MRILLKYVTRNKHGKWYYRRRIPAALQAYMNQAEFKRCVGDTEREALAMFPVIQKEFDTLIKKAQKVVSEQEALDPKNMTALQKHLAAQARAKELSAGSNGLPSLSPQDAYIMAMNIRDSLPLDDEGNPTTEPDIEHMALNIVSNPEIYKRPQPTLLDAKNLYLQDKTKGLADKKKYTNHVNRALQLLESKVSLCKEIKDLSRHDAREVRNHLLDQTDLKVSSARRYLNTINAIINYAITELEIKNTTNPFRNLELRGHTIAHTERIAMPEDILSAVRERIEMNSKGTLWNIWRILQNTGCRLAEISGLMVSDLFLETPIPYFQLIEHEHRRLKSVSSVRWVPLIGEALEAAKDALKETKQSPYLFPQYGRVRGADSASQALMGHIRAITPDARISNHSLRHRMKERLSLAGASGNEQNIVLGHELQGVQGRYLGNEARLRLAETALRKALDVT